jgi:hypothetical protein
MNPGLQALIGFSMLVSALALGFVAIEVRRIREEFIRVSHQFSDQSSGSLLNSSKHGGGTRTSPAGYAIYIFRQGRWELESDLSTHGFEPSAPAIPGAYEGHVIKKESRPTVDH